MLELEGTLGVTSFNPLILQMRKLRPREGKWLILGQDKMESSHEARVLDWISRNNKLEKRGKKAQIAPQVKI